MKSERHPSVGMFFEALLAAAQSEEDILVMQANELWVMNKRPETSF